MTKDIEEPKMKRELNKWQLFLKSCIPNQPKDAGMGQKVTSCSIQYKDLKTNDPNKLEQIVDNIRKVRNMKQTK